MNSLRRFGARRVYLGIALLVILSLIVSACGTAAPAPAASTGGEQSAAAPAADSAAAPAPAGLKEVPRNRLKIMRGGQEGQHIDYELWNPYAVGANHQNGANIMYETAGFLQRLCRQGDIVVVGRELLRV